MSSDTIARMAAVAEPAATLAPLPPALALRIFALLPVDTRLRCREVCRAWRVSLEERSLWTRLDLRSLRYPLNGYAEDEVGWNALLKAAAARAGGELVALDADTYYITFDEVLRVAAANAGTLREVTYQCSEDKVAALLRAAPLLEVFHADAICSDAALLHNWLRNEPPFGPLRIQSLVFFVHLGWEHGADDVDVHALAADVAAHASLQKLTLRGVDLRMATAMGALVDAVLERRLHQMRFERCAFSRASVPALARLIGSDALKTLAIDLEEQPEFLDVASAAALGAALRATTSLTSLELQYWDIWQPLQAGVVLIGALISHPSLEVLQIGGMHIEDSGVSRTAVGATLGMLIAANAPALNYLGVYDNLCDEGSTPLFSALRANTHLGNLYLDAEYTTEAFVRDTIIPVVRERACGSLALTLNDLYLPIAREAEALALK